MAGGARHLTVPSLSVRQSWKKKICCMVTLRRRLRRSYQREKSSIILDQLILIKIYVLRISSLPY